MIVKLFELRDRGTFIPVMATKVQEGTEQETYLLRRSGYTFPNWLIIMTGLAGGTARATCCPYDWGSDTRTRTVAHAYIEKHFDTLESGAVIDVEFILGETPEPKLSERVTA